MKLLLVAFVLLKSVPLDIVSLPVVALVPFIVVVFVSLLVCAEVKMVAVANRMKRKKHCAIGFMVFVCDCLEEKRFKLNVYKKHDSLGIWILAFFELDSR